MKINELRTPCYVIDEGKLTENLLIFFPLLFVPAAAGVMELWAEMGEMLLPILIAIIPVTVLVMVSAGKTTQALTGCKNKEADNDAAAE